jgi:hypothetical protein
MDIISNLKKSTIDSLGYETVYLEKPMSSLIDFDWKNILDAPPKNSSKTTIEELKLVAQSTKNRSSKDIELIHNIDKDLDLPYILLLKRYNLKYPKNYIDLFYDIVYPVLINTKNYWNRARPKQLAKYYNVEINVILTDTHHTASYPSGHTVYSKLVSNIIKNIYPQVSTKELDNIVLETAKARVLQGVHYPTDNKASIEFANFLFDKLNFKLRKYL